MKRFGIPLLMLAVLAIGIRQLPDLVAQDVPIPPPAPAAGSEVPRVPAAPAPPPPVQHTGGPGGDLQPGLPHAGVGIGLPPYPGMPGGPGAEYPYQTWSQLFGSQVPHVSRPADPHVMKLTEEYNKLEQHVMQLAQELRRSPPEGEVREKLLQQIVEATEKQFQLRHEVRKIEVERLQKQLAELEHQLQQREERKKEIVDRRVAQLTDQGDALRWEPLTPPGVNPYGPAEGMLFAPGMPGSWVPPQAGTGPAFPGQRYGVGAYPVPDGYDPFAVVPGHPTPPPMGNAPAAAESQRPSEAVPASVVEAQTRFEIAERDLARLKPMYDAATVPKSELDHAEDAVRLAKIRLEEARRDQELKVKMMELDLQKGEAELAAAQAELQAIQQQAEQKKDDPGLAAEVRRAAAAVKQTEMEFQRAKLMFERQLQRADREHSEHTERPAR